MAIKPQSNIYKKYRILSTIGDGGFSQVYKVEPITDRSPIKKKYALKYSVNKNRNDEDITRRRFEQEIAIYKKLNTERVALYHDSFCDDYEQYLVMEFVEGQNLREIIKRNGKLTTTVAVNYAIQIAEGISELHNLGVIHRDIKSNNILITKDKNVKIIDLGLALDDESQRLTQENKVVGSVFYMAPEICLANSKPSVRSDIYALGILLFEMLTGSYPISGKDQQETLKLQRSANVPNLLNYINAPQALANVIIKATAKDPNKRYATMWDMRRDLSTCLDTKRVYEKPLDLRKVKPKNTIQEKVNSKKFIIASISVIALILLIGIILLAVYIR
ncbi:serine/threonine protein kinase [Mycoplasmopsis caviae]|uniref:Serine/threonine protein kinase n=1 Tax=Mycoplasmopsis caviae TaxID=55603 RepID=A0A3P8MEJ7_9BACT|nr:serine/threonine-protein kinase [Mycoplasmopsis caviae]UUD35365.1 serine/threonine protein kinase [Mycoplasmopsis caviae]VDR41856.1 serine/threonine protein kinase [Mycoplasmopsis caviae]